MCQDQTDSEPISLEFASELHLPAGTGRNATALALTSAGDLLALFSVPPRIVRWNSDLTYLGSSDEIADILDAPTDIVSTNRMEIIICDPWSQSLARLNRRHNLLPPILLGTDEVRFEPLSAVTLNEGTIFILNGDDGDIWRLDNNGILDPIQWSVTRGGVLNQPSALDMVTGKNWITVLDGDQIRVFDPYGGYKYSVPHQVESPYGIGTIDNLVWIAGDGLSCLDVSRRSTLLHLTPQDLDQWNLQQLADVQPLDSDRIVVLNRSPVKISILNIVR